MGWSRGRRTRTKSSTLLDYGVPGDKRESCDLMAQPEAIGGYQADLQRPTQQRRERSLRAAGGSERARETQARIGRKKKGLGRTLNVCR